MKRALATVASCINPDQGIDYCLLNSVPDLGFNRTQLTRLDEKLKVRSVWGRAFHYILLESLAAQPFSDALRAADTFIHFGKDPIVSVPDLIDTRRQQSPVLLTADWSDFDASIHVYEILTAFRIIHNCVNFPDPESEIAFYLMVQLFIHKKLAAPDGCTYMIQRGTPSGSAWTTIVNSIINALRIRYLILKITGHQPNSCDTLGDDSFTALRDWLSINDLCRAAHKESWSIRPDKTLQSQTQAKIVFLGRSSQGGLNQRDLAKCCLLLLLTEYPVSSGEISAYRAMSIARDAGNTSAILNRTAYRLRKRYGLAPVSRVPRALRSWYDIQFSHFK